jgi:glutamyl-tRNA synthetase
MRRVRTRFAPSPTGPLHIGGVRTALYAYLFAKKNNGDFILRIEDTDTARSVKGSEDVINESLAWCGIVPDESVAIGGPHAPYRQSERKDMYMKYALELIEKGKAYWAFDTEEETAAWREKSAAENNGISKAYNYETRMSMRNSLSLSADEVADLITKNTPAVVRFKIDKEDDVTFRDEIRDEVTFKSSQLDDRVLLKSDGMPTYHLANVIDDHLMEITHVHRGEEWLASTPLHILLYKAFGWEAPSFAHLPLFLKPDGKGKLSKRDGDRLGFPVFCTQFKNPDSGEITQGFREKGFERDAFVNFIAMLGWNDGTERELFTLEDLKTHFSIDRVHKAGAKFNFEKAVWFNQQYLHNLSSKDLTKYCEKEISAINPSLNSEFIEKYCEIYRNRISYGYELPAIGHYMYSDITDYDKDTLVKKWKPEFKSFFENYISKLVEMSFNSADDLEAKTKSEIESAGLGLGNILPVYRIALTGTMKGPSIFDTMVLIGKDKSIERIAHISNLIA